MNTAINKDLYSLEPWGHFFRIYYKGTSGAFDDDYKERYKIYSKKMGKYPYAYEDYKKTQSSPVFRKYGISHIRIRFP